MKGVYSTIERVLRKYKINGKLRIEQESLISLVEELEAEVLQLHTPTDAPRLLSVEEVSTNSRYTELTVDSLRRGDILPKVRLDDIYRGGKIVAEGFVALSKNPSDATTAAIPCKFYGYYVYNGSSVSLVADVHGIKFTPMTLKMTRSHYRAWMRIA